MVKTDKVKTAEKIVFFIIRSLFVQVYYKYILRLILIERHGALPKKENLVKSERK